MDGFSVAARMRGKECVEGIIAERVVVATCQKMVNYGVGVMSINNRFQKLVFQFASLSKTMSGSTRSL